MGAGEQASLDKAKSVYSLFMILTPLIDDFADEVCENHAT